MVERSGKTARVGRAAQALLSKLLAYAGPTKDRHGNITSKPGEWFAWPSVRLLSAKMGYKDPDGRQVYRLLKELEQAGLIERIESGGGRRNNTYLLTCMNDAQIELDELDAARAQQAENAIENIVSDVGAAPAIVTGQQCPDRQGTPVRNVALSDAVDQKQLNQNNNHNTPQSGDAAAVVVGMLTARGLEEKTARTLTEKTDPEYVRFVCSLADGKNITNPVGFIRAALKTGAERLDGFDEFKTAREYEQKVRSKAGIVIDQATDEEIIEADPRSSVVLRANDGEDPQESSEIGRDVIKGASSIESLLRLVSTIEKNRTRRSDQEKLRLARADAERRELDARRTVRVREFLTFVYDDTVEHEQHNYRDRVGLVARTWPGSKPGIVSSVTIARAKIIDDDTLFKTADPWQLFELLHQAAQRKLVTTNTTHDRTEPASVEQGGLFSLTTGGTR